MRSRPISLLAASMIVLGAGTAVAACTSAPSSTSSSTASASSTARAPAPPRSAASAATSSAAPSASSAAAASALKCDAPCGPGTSCQLTKKGPACVACAPGSLPTCQDGQFVQTCTDEGAFAKSTDCKAEKARCDGGRCVELECTPNETGCFEGDVYKCNADGTARTLVTNCVIVDKDGGMSMPNGPCQTVGGVAACRQKCMLPDHTIVAMRDCAACPWEGVPFCATESAERGCTDWICLTGGDMTAGAVAMPCYRDTKGLVVPGSEKLGACEGSGPVGEQKITYEVCNKGKPEPATRVAPCVK